MRYETAVLLGEGGTGEVYRARDPRLDRWVALKILRSGDPRLVERFLREARLQARVEHELVCKVYEVGEMEDGRAYLAMEYIAGETLEALADRLDLPTQLDLVRQVAEAVEAAHEIGLIHRDLKPANLLIESTADGKLRPHVVDFGLAREFASEGLTETGVLLGTPGYLSPEQARGEVHALDRRTDVFALGAVLYRLTTGRPPFVGESTAETLVQVLACTPPTPRKLVPEIPIAVERIILRCLEPEPFRRYETARDLALDLARYLDGERVLAQRSSWWVRVARRVRRHRAASAGVAAALAIILALAGLGVCARVMASRGAVAAQRYGQEVEQIAASLRRASLLPLHDTRPERDVARARLARLEAGLDDLPAAARGPAEGAVGRGFLALRDYHAARRHLEAAWQAGERSPEVAGSLGRTLGALYQTELAASARLGSEAQRTARRREIERDLRDPALRALRSALPAAPSTLAESTAPEVSYALGWIDLLERRDDAALKRARAAYRADRGHFEANQLEGDVYAIRAQEAWEHGAIDAGLVDLKRALAAYARAEEIARSDVDLALAQCWRWAQVLAYEDDRGGDLAAPFRQATAACARARAGDPSRVRVDALESTLYRDRGSHEMELGLDPRPTFARGVALAQRALRRTSRREPDERAAQAIAWTNLAAIHSLQAEYEDGHGIDPEPSLRASIACGRKAVEVEAGSFLAHLNLGVSASILGEVQSSRGQDPTNSIRLALAAFRSARRIDPVSAVVDHDEGLAHLALAEWRQARSEDARSPLETAIELFEHGLARKVDDGILGALVSAHGLAATIELAAGRDPRPALERALGPARQAIANNPRLAMNHSNLAELWRLRAEYEASRPLGEGLDPAGDLALALAAVAEAQRLDSAFASAYQVEARVHLLAARRARDLGRSAKPLILAARRALARAEAIDPGNTEIVEIREQISAFEKSQI